MNQNDDPLYYYEKKVEELDLLLDQSTSKALTNLIIEAKDYTQSAVEDLLVVQKLVIAYLSDHNLKTKEKLTKYQGGFAELQKAKNNLESAQMPAHAKEIAKQALNKEVQIFRDKMEVEGKLNSLVNEIHQAVAKQMSDVLLTLIFKPDNKSFNYDKVTDILSYILEQKIPLLAEAKMIAGFSNKARRKKQIAASNDLLAYLEKYIDVLQRWLELSAAYAKVILGEIAPSGNSSS